MDWMRAAAEEIHDTLDDIEADAEMSATVEQDMAAGFQIWVDRVVAIINRHCEEPHIPPGYYFKDDLDGGSLVKKEVKPMEPLDIVDDRKVLGVLIKREGGENDPHAHAVVEIRMSDGSYIELGREPLSANFGTYWSLEKWTNRE